MGKYKSLDEDGTIEKDEQSMEIETNVLRHVAHNSRDPHSTGDTTLSHPHRARLPISNKIVLCAMRGLE